MQCAGVPIPKFATIAMAVVCALPRRPKAWRNDRAATTCSRRGRSQVSRSVLGQGAPFELEVSTELLIDQHTFAGHQVSFA